MKTYKLSTIIALFLLISEIATAENLTIENSKSITKSRTIGKLQINKNGTLTLSKGVTLTLKIPSTVAGKLILNPGAQIEFDYIKSGSLNILPGGLLQIEGIKTKPCKIYAKKGSAVAFISDGNINGGGRIVATYCTFFNLGGKPLYRAYEYSPKTDTGEIKLGNCTFDSCFQVKSKYKLPKGSKISFINCKWRNSQEKPKSERKKWEEWYIFETMALPGSKGSLINCDFDKMIGLFFPADYVIEDCLFRKGIKCYSHWFPKWKSFKRNFIRSLNDASEMSIPYGVSVEDCIFIKDTRGWNPHFINISNGTGKGGIYGSIFWFTGLGKNEKRGPEGDGIMPGPAKTGTRNKNIITLERNIVLPNNLGPYVKKNISCTMLTVLFKSTNSSVEVKQNTIFTNEIGGNNLGETQICEEIRVIGIKSNLFVGDGTGFKINNLGHTETDAITAKNADYNAGWKISTGSNYVEGGGKGYNKLKFSKTTILGKHDIDNVDPQFVDVNRNPFSWDKKLGGKGNMQGVMDRLSPSGGKKVIDLIKYIREGFRPQNQKLKAAGDPKDGSPDIGAVKIK